MRQTKFLLAALLIGFNLMRVVLTQPFELPDEGPHWLFAWSVKTGLTSWDRGLGTPQGLTFEVPHSAVAFVDVHTRATANTAWHPERISSPAMPYPPTGYIVHAIVLGLSETLGLSIAACFFLARLSGAAMWTIAVLFALSAFSRRRFAILAIALLPGIAGPLCGISADTMLMSCILVVLTGFAPRQDDAPPASTAYLVVGALAAILVAASKFVYLPLALLPLCWPTSLFASTRQRHLFSAIVATVSVVVAAGWWAYAGPVTREGVQRLGIDMNANLSAAIANPLAAMMFAVRTSMIAGSTWFTAVGIVGATGRLLLGGVYHVAAVAMLLVFVTLRADGLSTSMDRRRWAALALVLCNVLGVIFAFAIAMRVGDNAHDIIQGRHLAPAVLAVFVLLPSYGAAVSARITPRIKSIFQGCALVALLYVDFISLMALWALAQG